MMMKKYVLFLLLIKLWSVSWSQNLEIVALKPGVNLTDALEFPKEDYNGDRCGLVELKRLPSDASFEGNVFYAEYNGNDDEWWVYMTKGSRWLTIKTNEYLPLQIEFEEPIQSDTTYVMIVFCRQNGVLYADVVEDDGREFEIAMDYYNTGDYQKAMDGFRTAADLGDAVAMNNIGVMYAKGQGVSLDEEMAVSWYRKSAERGYSLGQCNLGTMYRAGKGVGQDIVKAWFWYLNAAEQGEPLAQHNIGTMFVAGEGVSQDYVEAVKWFQRAADQGFEQSIEALKQMYYLMEE